MQLKPGFRPKTTSRSQSSNYDWDAWLNGESHALVRGEDYVATDEQSVDDVEKNLVGMFKINAKKKGLKPLLGEFTNGKQSGDDDYIDTPKKGKESEFANKSGIIIMAQGPADEFEGQVYSLQQSARSAAWLAGSKMKKYLNGEENTDLGKKKIADAQTAAKSKHITESDYSDDVKAECVSRLER
jgi:hypothetical protein